MVLAALQMAYLDDGSEKADAHHWVSRRPGRLKLGVAACLAVTSSVLTVLLVRRRTGQDKLIGESKLLFGEPLTWLSAIDWSWLMEDMLRIGSIRLGLPGLSALGLASTPMLEAMPRIWATGNVGKLPLLPYSAMLASGALWLTYGLLVDSPVVWCPNAIQVVFGLVYCSVFLRYCPARADWLPLSRVHHIAFCVVTAFGCISLVMFLPPSLAATFLGLIGSSVTVVMFAGPLAAIRTVLADKNTKSLPLGFTCVVTFNCALWLGYGWSMAGDPFVYVPNLLGLLVACLQLSLFFRFGLPR